MKPKFWCKHCKIFVRDTKLEKQNHEATPKHQGNLQRFLRDLHRGHERDERDAKRAKDEVARLNGITAGPPTDTPVGRVPRIPATPDTKGGRSTDRKRQLQQLAEMGIAIPEEARREMAMVGDWQTQSVVPVYDNVEDAKLEDDEDDKKTLGLAIGVRKRKHEGDEEKEEAGAVVAKKGWGSTTRGWGTDNDDLDSLLDNTKAMITKSDKFSKAPPEIESDTRVAPGQRIPDADDKPIEGQHVKDEDSGAVTMTAADLAHPPILEDTTASSKPDVDDSEVLFRKRKPKSIRQR